MADNNNNNTKFFKFPRTEHLSGSTVVDDDVSIPASQFLKPLQLNPNLRLVVQEKVDGANVGVHFDYTISEWEPLMQKRGGLIETSEKPQYDVFRNWCYENLEVLKELISDRYVLFGEWVWCTHGVVYDNLPSFFIGFDLFDKTAGHYLSSKKLNEILQDHIIICPHLYEGKADGVDKAINLKNTTDDHFASFLKSLIAKSKYSSKETAEGVYLRIEDDEKVLFRAKFRRATFTAGREDFSKNVQNNTLKQ